jgi:hypothetical protein
MADRVFHAEPPLSDMERVARFGHKTKIAVEHSFEGITIRRDWVRESAAEDAPYGYAENRGTYVQRESKLEMEVPWTLDIAALTQAILTELQRQRDRATAKP